MPRETFFNLEESKRNKILDAAVKEFTEHELHKARVSNIIKEADIPRGSFYQYFEDLDDLYYHVIDGVFDSLFYEGRKHANITNDIFRFTELTFEVDLDRYLNDKRHRFIMNVMKSIGMNPEYLEIHNLKRKEYIVSVFEKMDLRNLRFNEEEDLIRLYEFLQNIKIIVIRKSMMSKLSKEDSMNLLRWHLDMLKNGLIN